MRTMPALAPQQPLSDVLTELQRIGSHLGQVRENNRTLGVIALEDVVEAFVGEVEDASHLDAEHDPRPGHEHTGEDVRPAASGAADGQDALSPPSDERLRTPAGPATAQEADD
jgi:hypothetical protein